MKNELSVNPNIATIAAEDYELVDCLNKEHSLVVQHVKEQIDLHERNRWQPIGTAPINQIVLVANIYSYCLAKKFYQTGNVEKDWNFYDLLSLEDKESFTHWMPLPSLPTNKE